MATLYPEAAITWDCNPLPNLFEGVIAISLDIAPEALFTFAPYEISVTPVDPGALFNEDTGEILFNEDTGTILTAEPAL